MHRFGWVVWVQIFLAGHMPALAYYTLAAVEAAGMITTLAKVIGILDKLSSGRSIWQAYLDTLGVLAVAVLVQVSHCSDRQPVSQPGSMQGRASGITAV